MDVRAIREALERGLDKEHLKKSSDAMECMTTHRWYWRWAQNLEANCKEALATLSVIDPEAIRAEARAEAIEKLKPFLQHGPGCDWMKGWPYHPERKVCTCGLDAILSAEPAKDVGRCEVHVFRGPATEAERMANIERKANASEMARDDGFSEEKRVYILDRYCDGIRMAEGARVMASSLEEAIEKARHLPGYPRFTHDSFRERRIEEAEE